MAAATQQQPQQPATPDKPAAGDTVESLRAKLAAAEEAARKSENDRLALKTKLDVEGPRAAAEVRAAKEAEKKANDRVKEVEGELKKKLDSLEVTSLSEKERNLAGEDLVKVVTKIAREVTDGRLAETMPAITNRVDLLEMMGEDGYFLALDEGVPNWKAVNDEPRFMAWLNQVDPSTNRLRLDRVKRAEAMRQGLLVVEIFRAFLEGREIGAPKAVEPAPRPKGLDVLVDPGNGGGDAPAAADGAKRNWSRREIKAHYDEKTRGDWRGREDEWRKIEIDINAAYREGRIRG